jgi:hypothetical protein
MSRARVRAARGRRAALLLALVQGAAACTGAQPEPMAGTEATSEGSTVGTTALASTDGSTHETSADGGTTTEAASTGGTATDESGPTDDTATDTGVMPPVPKSCALATIDPAADPAAVIDAGDGETQIPTRVGEALLRNCGCHYTDDVPIGLYVDYSSNAQPLSTLADFHGDFMGTFPMGFEDMPTYLAVELRVVDHDPLPMPPLGCGVEGEPGLLSAADLALLTKWLAAGAPSGASFP